MAPLLVLAGVLGLAIGSFLNVVIWRIPRGESVARPRSACPRCATPIAPRDNVPLVSWLVLRGRCRHCHEPIAIRYPLVEATTGVLFVLVTWWQGPTAALPAFLYLAAIAVALTLIDIDHHRLPDAIVLPSYGIAGGLLAVAAAADGAWPALGRGAAGAAILFAFYFLLVIVYPAGMGFGDVKLAGVLGLYLGWVGWGALAVGAFAAFVLGGLYSIGLLMLRRAGRRSGIPFGPWMLGGAAVGLAVGEQVWSSYLGLLI